MDYDTPAAYSETTPVARKSYRCCECGGVIPKGTRHIRFSGVWDGEWKNYRTCQSCAAIRDYVASLSEDHPGSYEFRNLISELSDRNDGLNPNLPLTVMYNGGISGVGKWQCFHEDTLRMLYEGKFGYEVIPFLYPYSIMSRLHFRTNFRLLENEADMVLTMTEGKPLLCLAECGVFEVLAVLKTAEELSLFRDPLDTRPKQFFTLHPGYLHSLRKQQGAISSTNTL